MTRRTRPMHRRLNVGTVLCSVAPLFAVLAVWLQFRHEYDLFALILVPPSALPSPSHTLEKVTPHPQQQQQQQQQQDPQEPQALVPWQKPGALAIGGRFILLELLAQTNSPASITSGRKVETEPGVDEGMYDYELRAQFGVGGFGEVWAAVRVPSHSASGGIPRHHLDRYSLGDGNINTDESGDDDHVYVLKRFIAGDERKLSALRELHFGNRLRGLDHISRFVEHFSESDEVWLVFRHEGTSLRSLLYISSLEMDSQSAFWARMKREQESGSFQHTTMQSIVFQLLQALRHCHSRNITHRDVKPSNVLLQKASLGGQTIRSRSEAVPLGTDFYLRLADFGSAVDGESLAWTYPAHGPSKAEETVEYAPPEVLFSEAAFAVQAPWSYDMWSVGVLLLELVLGSTDVFLIDGRTKARMEARLTREQSSAEVRERAYKARALFEYCIYRPSQHGHGQVDPHLSQQQACTDDQLQALLRKYDPMQVGAPSTWALKLLRRLLQWEPLERISADEALQHAWFRGAYTCSLCGAEFDLPSQLQQHSCSDSAAVPTVPALYSRPTPS